MSAGPVSSTTIAASGSCTPPLRQSAVATLAVQWFLGFTPLVPSMNRCRRHVELMTSSAAVDWPQHFPPACAMLLWLKGWESRFGRCLRTLRDLGGYEIWGISSRPMGLPRIVIDKRSNEQKVPEMPRCFRVSRQTITAFPLSPLSGPCHRHSVHKRKQNG